MEMSNGNNFLFKQRDGLCRVCLSATKENKCIFTTQITIKSTTRLWEQIKLYGGIEVKQGDGLPSKICKKCVSQIRVIDEFRTQCQESDKKLRSLGENVENKIIIPLRTIFRERDNETKEQLGKSDLSRNEKSNSNQPVKSYDDWGISRKNVRDNDSLKQKETNSSQNRTIVKVSSLENFCGQRKILKKKLFEISKISAQKLENFMTKVARRNDENSVRNKGGCTPKRLFVIGRLTSMENLKNDKERQRQYVKKITFAKNKSNDSAIARINESPNVSVKRANSDLTVCRFECTKRQKLYRSKKSSKEHEFSRDKDKFFCERCNKRFKRPDEFLKHAKSHDLNKKLEPAKCKICNKNFRKALTMVRHLNVHKRENPRAVYAILKDIRDKRIKKESKFYNETDKANELSNIKEHSYCADRNFSQFEESITEKCADSTGLRNCLDDSSNIDSNEMKFANNEIKFSDIEKNKVEFSDSSGATNAIGESQIPSDDKSAIKLINSWIKEELDSENEGKGFPCDYCSKSYASKKSLSRHKFKTHNVNLQCDIFHEIQDNERDCDKTKFYRCKDCDKMFETETKLEVHAKIHVREKETTDKNFKRFLCHVCSKTFRHNTGLMFHMRTHTGYKPHVCKYCGRGFTSNSNCTNHERTHTGDKPFICHFCSAAFAKSCTLKNHLTIHTGEANYHCKTCGKSFRRLKYLKEHRFTHTGEKPFACKICGTAYSHSGSLFVHEKKCKVQRDNSQETMKNYSDESIDIGHRSKSTTDAPLFSNQRLDNTSTNTNENKIFNDDAQRINCTNDNVPSNRSNVPSNPHNFNIIGQMFHS